MKPIYLNRKQAAHYVTEMWGVPCSYKWLAKLAVVGGGPKHWKWGRAVRYRADALDAWAFGRMTGPFASSSEAHQQLRTFSYLKSGEGMPFVEA